MAIDRNLTHFGPSRKTDSADLRLDPGWRHYNERLQEAEGRRLLKRLTVLLERMLAELARLPRPGVV